MLRNRWKISIERQQSMYETLFPEIKKLDYRIPFSKRILTKSFRNNDKNTGFVER